MIPPPSKHRRHDPTFQQWLHEGEPSFDHTVILAIRDGKGFIGHAAALLKKEEVVIDGAHLMPRFIPLKAIVSLSKISLLYIPFAGKVKESDNNFRYNYAVEIPLTYNQFITLESDINFYKQNSRPSGYSVLNIGSNQNCTGFAIKVLDDIGINIRNILPTKTISRSGIIPSTITKSLLRIAKGYDQESFQEEQLGGKWLRSITHSYEEREIKIWSR